MSEHFSLIVAVLVCSGVLAAVLFRHSSLTKAIAIILVTYPLGVWSLVTTYFLYQHGLAHTISRHNNTVVSLSSSPTYGNASITLHVVLGLFLLGAGTYFGLRRLREWRNAA